MSVFILCVIVFIAGLVVGFLEGKRYEHYNGDYDNE